MTIGGKATPVYVVTDEEIASGAFTVEAGPAIAISVLSASGRGVIGGNTIPVYPVNAAYVATNGVRDGLNAMPVVNLTNVRPVGNLQRAIPVYVTYGSL